MKKLLVFLFALTLLVNAQLKVTIDTDKNEYEYGETIKIICKLTNTGDTSITFRWGSYRSCQAGFQLNDFYSGLWTACLLTEEEITVGPHRSKCYLWNIDPYVFGLPDKDGEQLLIGNFTGIDGFSDKDLTDTTTFYAPVFLGGQLTVNYNFGNAEIADSIRESYNAEIVEKYGISTASETWQITGIHIDSVYSNLSSVAIFNSVEYNRFWMYDSIYVTSVKKVDDLEKGFKLSQNYPNPFNPSTTIKFTIPSVVDAKFASTTTKIIVYDILGREVKTLLNKKLSPGSYEIGFNGTNLSSGIYFYRLTSNNFSQTKEMLFVK